MLKRALSKMPGPAIVLAILALVTAVLGKASAPSSAASSGTIWGVYSESQNGLSGAQVTQQLQSTMGRAFAGQRVYTAMSLRLPQSQDKDAAAAGRLIYHNLNSWYLVGGVKTCYPWADVAAGKQDAILVQRAAELKAWGYDKIVLGFHHEPTVNKANEPSCGSPSDYRAAYHHVVQVFRAQGITYPWAWTMTASSYKNGTAGLYQPPGSDFDFVGVDGYNRASRWLTPSQKFQAAMTYAETAGKPLFIGEIGSEELPGDPTAKATWITTATAMFEAYGNVKAIMWTNGDTYRLDSSPQALAAFVAAGKDAYYSP